jgi:hypothetical protein
LNKEYCVNTTSLEKSSEQIRKEYGPLKAAFVDKNMHGQFWCYETGNVIASVAGAGGFTQVYQDTSATFFDTSLNSLEKFSTIAADNPDAMTAVSIAGLIVIGSGLRKLPAETFGEGSVAVNSFDAVTTAVALGILYNTWQADTELVTQAASSFVVGSSFLKFSGQNPLFLKLGGVGLGVGGILLGAWGAAHIGDADSVIQMGIDVSTTIMGGYITKASINTYQGGKFLTCSYAELEEKALSAQSDEDKALYEENLIPYDPKSWVSLLFHPTKGGVARGFASVADKPIDMLDQATNWMLGYIPDKSTFSRPLATSAWARVPIRVVVTGFSAFAAHQGVPGMAEFTAACALWTGGDLLIGAGDSELKRAEAAERLHTPNRPAVDI